MNWGVELVAGNCPYCGEPVQLLIDPSAGAQQYIEDCQVCCRPMTVRVLETDPIRLDLFDEDEI